METRTQRGWLAVTPVRTLSLHFTFVAVPAVCDDDGLPFVLPSARLSFSHDLLSV